MLNQLFYRGPSIDVLHQDYAKERRIDDQAFVKASGEVRIEAPVERVWALLSDVPGWPAWAPGVHDVQLDAGVTEDARFTWANGRSRMRSRFAVVDPCHELTWTGEAFGAGAVDRNVLEPTGDGATRVVTEESMAGPLLVLVYGSAKLKATKEAWLTSLKAAVETR
jgi:uncharacterized protein YndB with AHSA1/START domain